MHKTETYEGVHPSSATSPSLGSNCWDSFIMLKKVCLHQVTMLGMLKQCLQWLQNSQKPLIGIFFLQKGKKMNELRFNEVFY